jgi:hypothetical protein
MEPVAPRGVSKWWRRDAAIVVFLLLLGLVVVVGAIGGLHIYLRRTTVTAEAKSPDGRYVVRLLDFPGAFIDRNFEVTLDSDGRKNVRLFRSPDEGRPPGTERFIWSTDSRYAVLVGRHFFGMSEHEGSSGESLYLLIDATTAAVVGCNSDQVREPHPFTFESLRALAKWPEDGALTAKVAASQR